MMDQNAQYNYNKEISQGDWHYNIAQSQESSNYYADARSHYRDAIIFYQKARSIASSHGDSYAVMSVDSKINSVSSALRENKYKEEEFVRKNGMGMW